jgi:hypothetical protein
MSRAEGFISAGAIPTKAITAKYPLAPPWPTEAYKKATRASKAKKRKVLSMKYPVLYDGKTRA